MKKVKKTLLTVVCAGALVIGSVAATMAYLTDNDSVKNTFTVGKVEILLDETDTDGSGTGTVTNGRDQGNKYKIYPGQTYGKDPKVTVKDGSEDCWLFVKIENGLSGIEVAAADGDTIAEQMAANGWTVVDQNAGVYGRAASNKAGDVLTVFTSFAIADSTTEAQLAACAGAEIVVTAYAVQEEGFVSASAAWDAAKTELGFTS